MARAQILIVDDHTNVLDSIEQLLQTEEAIEVIGKAYNAAQAIAMAQERLPDIILMDFCMGKVDGLEACRRIRHDDPGIDVIILSASDQLDHIDRAKEAGIADWVQKDAPPDELLKAINKVLAARARQ